VAVYQRYAKINVRENSKWKSRIDISDTRSNTCHKTQNENKQNKNATQKNKTLSKTDHTKTLTVNQGAREGYTVPVILLIVKSDKCREARCSRRVYSAGHITHSQVR
jgi:predicted ABC-type ATPase